jgi:hypothetical protein
MAEAVVDRLEAVEVEVAHGQQAPVALGARQGLRQAVGQQRAVGHAGQRVIVRQALELLFVFHAHSLSDQMQPFATDGGIRSA